jgi:hypothetical protein
MKMILAVMRFLMTFVRTSSCARMTVWQRRLPRGVAYGHMVLCILVVYLLHSVPGANAEDERAEWQPSAAKFRLPLSPIYSASAALYQDNPVCSQAKLVLWLARGQYAYTLFLTDRPAFQSASTPQESETIIIGAEGCRVRIRIERVD